jgi:hypothetical protein
VAKTLAPSLEPDETSIHDTSASNRPRGWIRSHHFVGVVKRFRYCRDPLFLVASAFYALNRFWWKHHVHSAFLHGQFNDLLLIPCALPPLLFLQRRLGLRKHDGPPDFREIILHLAIWSVLFEIIGPHLMRVTGDVRDVVAYAAGACMAGWIWQRTCCKTPAMP